MDVLIASHCTVCVLYPGSETSFYLINSNVCMNTTNPQKRAVTHVAQDSSRPNQKYLKADETSVCTFKYTCHIFSFLLGKVALNDVSLSGTRELNMFCL